MVLKDFLLHPIVQKRLKHSWIAMIDEMSKPASILVKFPSKKILKIKFSHIGLEKKQAKNTKTNWPAHKPSQAPPFPKTLATPFFKILVSPSAAENPELPNDRRKNAESRSIAE